MKLKLLMVIAAGIVATQSASAQWALTGNAGTNAATNYVGTSDSRSLTFRTNAIERMTILTNGRVGIGTTTPASNLDIYVATGGAQLGVRSDSSNAVLFFDKKHTSDYNTVSYRTAGAVQWQTGSIGNNNYVIKNMILGAPAISCLITTNYVGIGTNTPTEKLEVAGNIRAVGTIASTGIITALGGSSTNWNLAYGWGNHATAGYITAETDPQVGANTTNYVPVWNGSALATSGIYQSGNYYGLGTSSMIGSANFVLQSPYTSNYGGMYINQTGSGCVPFYGYAVNGISSCWTLWDQASGRWTVYNNGDRLTVANSGNVGIGTAAPAYHLDVQGSTSGSSYYNIQSKVNYVGSSDIRGIYAYSVPADGYGYGADLTGGYYGASCTANGGTYTGNAWGVAGYASGSAGTRYGVYGYAYNSGGAAWAGFFDGKTYAGSMVVGNSTTASSGYLLTVGGKVICTELKVQVQPFPDYVFDENYKLNSIYDVENFISQNKRLPGMPTACDIEDNGMSVGEMQSKLVEKVEEQTLYIIQLQKQIDELKKLMTDLSKK